VFTCWLHEGLCAAPEVNLVSDVGFHSESLPTPESMFANMPTRPMQFPLVHPSSVVRDANHDDFLEDVMFSGNLGRFLRRIRKAMHVRAEETDRPEPRVGEHR
jgi:hypothetical protein